MAKKSDLFGTLVTLSLTIGIGLAMRTCEAGDAESLRTIDSSGFAEPVLGDYNAWECGGGESSRSFTAINPLGKRVEGVVCCSAMGCTKACTLRWP